MTETDKLQLSTRVFVVAEIGNNHEGSFPLAERLVRAAAAAGADAVKFQTARAELFISAADEDRLRRFRSYEFSAAEWRQLAALARAEGLKFLSTPLDLESAELLDPLVDAFKIASGDITFYPLLDYVAQSDKPVILSTGASTMDEVRRAVERIRKGQRAGGGGLSVLHCVSAYPSPAAEANLRVIGKLASTIGVPVGYSDHVEGIEAAVSAVAAGARIIEKHFTIDKAQSSFRDHALSANPAQFAEMVQRIRRVELMMGAGEKVVQPSEQTMVPAIRRSIAAARDLRQGERLAAADFIWVRPGTGIAPGSESDLVGRCVTRNIRRGEVIASEDLA